MSKTHKALPDRVWQERLKMFARNSVWPHDLGNKPAPRQKKWHTLYQKIEACPKQHRTRSLFSSQKNKCRCGYHVNKDLDTNKPPGLKVLPSPSVTTDCGLEALPATIQSVDSGSLITGHGDRPIRTPTVSAFTGHGDRPIRTPTVSAPIHAADTQFSALGQSGSASQDFHTTMDMTKMKGRQKSHTDPSTSEPKDSVIKNRSAAGSADAIDCKPNVHDAHSQQQPLLPLLWCDTLPRQDHKWISSALFTVGAKGKLELRETLQLWYYPPQPALVFNMCPIPDRFFCHPLLLWMPYKLWKMRLLCMNPACENEQLTGAGLHKRTREILDIDGYYHMATETLNCPKCRASYLSWSPAILDQLDIGHRSQFRAILTRKYACDIRVIRLLRERGLGNSSTRLMKQLNENHSEEWLQRTARYLTECSHFAQCPGICPLVFREPPAPIPVPSYKWILSVYGQDIVARLDDIKAHITCTYGSVLKMDSTKKVTRKLAGTAKSTALWLSSVSNEFGQILVSVLTAQEGPGLDQIAADLIKRYSNAGVEPPIAMYVDCGCCVGVGESKLQTRFTGWPNLYIRLDIWHFMRRLAAGCTTDSHQLYGTFMSRLSACIFEWDAEDVSLLRQAKRTQLEQVGMPLLSDADIRKHITKVELALHCRRRTRAPEVTCHAIEELLHELDGHNGRDSLGVPLLDSVRMADIWNTQKRHLTCIQDPPNMVLYTETGMIKKGGVSLKTYRCARGSTSLESFHLHLNRFIPGTSANAVNFQAYLLEGLRRWNQDRAAASINHEPSVLRSYSGSLMHVVNILSEKVLGKKQVPSFQTPGQYTGELIGIEYLYRQTGEALQDFKTEECSQMLEEVTVEDEEDEGFDDIVDETMGTLDDENIIKTVQTLPVQSLAEDGDSSMMSVDSDNIPGFNHVDHLAGYLVDLRQQAGLSISNQQATEIIGLWGKLDAFDKDRIVYSARHQDKLRQGRFRSSKKTDVATPGVDSTKRCLIGASGSPAQWPNCSRLVESICIKLCSIYPSPKKREKVTFSRWTMILNDYKKLRQIVLGNGMVMEKTTLQLVELNQNTLIQWHNKRQKAQELAVLLQGTNLPSACPVADQPLLSAKVRPCEALKVQHAEHMYRVPVNTAGQAKHKRPRMNPPANILPKNQSTARNQLFATTSPIAVSLLPAQTVRQAYRLILPSGSLPTVIHVSPSGETAACGSSKRTYHRTVTSNRCKKCGDSRTLDTGHSQYKGKVYCPFTEVVSKEEWLEHMRKK